MTDVSEIKLLARGRWREILCTLGGLSPEILDGRNHACPRCGGHDRFSLVGESRGAVLCRKCFDSKNGDGIAAIGWLRQIDFPESLKLLSEYLGGNTKTAAGSKPVNSCPVARLAAAKSCPEFSLREYGAAAEGSRVTFPAYGPDREQCTSFGVWPDATGKRSKGLFDKGKPAGLFFPSGDLGPRFPVPSETIILCEGVKDAAAYHSLGYYACGLNTDQLAQKFVPLFQDAHVVLMPDRTSDAEGKAQTSAGRLASVTASVKIGTLPLPLDGNLGDDVRDALKQNEGEQLVRAAVESAKAWNEPEADNGVRRISMQQAVAERLDEHRQGPIPRVKLGIEKLDATLGGGIPYGSLVVVGALSSHGKTAFSLQVTHYITGGQGIPATFISLEMGAGELADRTLSYASDSPKEHWHKLLPRLDSDAADHFQGAATCTLVEGVSELDDVKREITLAFEGGSKVVIIDYAQLIDAGSRDDTNAIMRRVSAEFKRLAKQHHGIIVCLAQLNRRVEERKPLVPRLTDIEYGSKLGHDSDVVLFLVWPHRIDQREPPNRYQVFIEKNRNGQSKVGLNCNFNPPRQRITEDEFVHAQSSDF